MDIRMNSSRETGMETNTDEPSKRQTMIRTVLGVSVTEGILVAVSWAIGWPSISGPALFFLGLAALFLGYGIETLFFGGGYVVRGGGNRYDRKSRYDRFKEEEGGEPGSDLEKAKKAPGFLNDLMVAGMIAVLLSLVLPRFF